MVKAVKEFIADEKQGLISFLINKSGAEGSPYHYVWEAWVESPLYQDYINSVLKRIIRKHGLKKITPHGFRHTHAALTIKTGVDPVNAAKRLGHASSQMTLDTYSHSTVAGEKKAITKFVDYLDSAKG